MAKKKPVKKIVRKKKAKKQVTVKPSGGKKMTERNESHPAREIIDQEARSESGITAAQQDAVNQDLAQAHDSRPSFTQTDGDIVTQEPRAWTDAGGGEGLGYPSEAYGHHSGDWEALHGVDDLPVDVSTVSGVLPTLQATVNQLKALGADEDGDHVHKWKRGMSPGNKYLRICRFPGCGVTETVTREEYDRIA
jgi:hypothetical protein